MNSRLTCTFESTLKRRQLVNHEDLKELIGRHEAQFNSLGEDLKGIAMRRDRLAVQRRMGIDRRTASPSSGV
jgi:hypothetical protein